MKILKTWNRSHLAIAGLLLVALLIGIYSQSKRVISQVIHPHGFLLAPTGTYPVGFKDFVWRNEVSHCPDPMFKGTNVTDFSPDNLAHCHEIAVRIYYPATQRQKNSPVYPPVMLAWQDSLKDIPGVTPADMQQIADIHSYATQGTPLVEGKFPVILFSPAYGFQAQLYEGIITELVSHGYIVVGINSLFINGDIALLNDHIVKQDLSTAVDMQSLLQVQAEDLAYVYDKLHKLHTSETIFVGMDLDHVGALGHALGGGAVLNAVRTYDKWFQAAAGLVAIGEGTADMKPVTIPFLMEVSADWAVPSMELAKNNYLVRIAPSLSDHRYSHNLSFTDYATLKKLSAYQAKVKHDAAEQYSVVFFSQEPTAVDAMNFSKNALVFIKNSDKWRLTYYVEEKRIQDIPIGSITGLQRALDNLPQKAPEALSLLDAEAIHKVIAQSNAAFANTADGAETLASMSRYLISFFNTFLKKEQDAMLAQCQSLDKNSAIQCGPAQGTIMVRVRSGG